MSKEDQAKKRAKLEAAVAKKIADGAATLTIEETAAFLRIGRNQCYEGVKAKEIPSIQIGKRKLVPRAALERKLAGA